MNRTLTITFNLNDEPWYDDETREMQPTDILAFAMCAVNNAITFVATDDSDVGFVKAELDGELLVSRNGKAPEEVKKLVQYQAIMRTLKHGE